MSNESSYFRIDGVPLPGKCIRNVNVTRTPLSDIGENVMLTTGEMVSLVRPSLKAKRIVRVQGEAIIPPPFMAAMQQGDILTFDDPHQLTLEGDFAVGAIPGQAVQPALDRVWWFGTRNGVFTHLPHGDPDVEITMFVPRTSVMVDKFESSFDEVRANYSWSFEGRTTG